MNTRTPETGCYIYHAGLNFEVRGYLYEPGDFELTEVTLLYNDASVLELLNEPTLKTLEEMACEKLSIQVAEEDCARKQLEMFP